jgi:hypothetical protein
MRQFFTQSLQGLLEIPNPIESVVFGSYPAKSDNAPTIEVEITWYRVADKIVHRIECLKNELGRSVFKDVFEELDKLSDTPLFPDQFRCLLESLGFQDITNNMGIDES